MCFAYRSGAVRAGMLTWGKRLKVRPRLTTVAWRTEGLHKPPGTGRVGWVPHATGGEASDKGFDSGPSQSPVHILSCLPETRTWTGVGPFKARQVCPGEALLVQHLSQHRTTRGHLMGLPLYLSLRQVHSLAKIDQEMQVFKSRPLSLV